MVHEKRTIEWMGSRRIQEKPDLVCCMSTIDSAKIEIRASNVLTSIP
ncbi:hypothetical protein [Vibrio gallaecicus]|nr:hypothetical protein [Vibrio gallaecicus]MDN3615490.1 hypothetical protein [Vibrio gallaecicus]